MGQRRRSGRQHRNAEAGVGLGDGPSPQTTLQSANSAESPPDRDQEIAGIGANPVAYLYRALERSINVEAADPRMLSGSVAPDRLRRGLLLGSYRGWCRLADRAGLRNRYGGTGRHSRVRARDGGDRRRPLSDP